MTEPKYEYTSATEGVCGSSLAEAVINRDSVFLSAEDEYGVVYSWRPDWVPSDEPQIAAFQGSLAHPAYLAPGRYTVSLVSGRTPMATVEVELVESRR